MKHSTLIAKRSIVIMILFLLINSLTLTSQNKRTTLTVLNIDSQGMDLSSKQLGNLVRIEIDKLDTFEVTDRYDVAYLLEKHKLDISNCYGKICLVETGKVLMCDLMVGGSIERYGETIIVTLKLVDVQNEAVISTVIREYLDLPLELQTMIRISINEMFGYRNEPDIVQRLTKEYDYENLMNNPDDNKVNLSGPRMGGVIYLGETADILKENKSEGGYDVNPIMFQFGYQFEIQYLNEGSYQALFEFIPTITGMDQSMLIPSLTILHGLRNNRNGFEFAFGPSVNIMKSSKGYFDNNNVWHLANDWDQPLPNSYDLENRMDSRGELKLSSSFVFAIGKTFKSGKLNIPVNAFFIPSKHGARFGISIGYNAKKK